MSASRRLFLSVSLLLGACNGGGGDPVQAICELALSCSCAPPPFATVEACVTDANMDIDELKTTAAAKGLTFSQACVDRTLTVFHDKLQCGSDFTVLATEACNLCQPVHGDKPVGAACSILDPEQGFSDCASDLSCDNGKCSEPCTTLAAGEACLKNDGVDIVVLGTCADGLYCDYTATKTCKPRVPSGGDCFGVDDCVTGLVCGPDNKCGTPPGSGEACTSSCAAELLCENGICVISPLEGEPCSANGECAEGLECGDSNVCAPPEPLVCDLLSDG